jgi:uncharacterized protein (TIGR02246 family)
MKNYGFLVLISVFGIKAQSLSDSTNPKAEIEIRKTLDDFAEARNVGDAKGMAAHFADDGVYTATGGFVFNGREAIEAVWARAFKINTAGRAVRTVRRIRFISPGVAIADSSVSTTGFPETGNPRLIDIYVLEKKGDRWQIAEAWTCFADRAKP